LVAGQKLLDPLRGPPAQYEFAGAGQEEVSLVDRPAQGAQDPQGRRLGDELDEKRPRPQPPRLATARFGHVKEVRLNPRNVSQDDHSHALAGSLPLRAAGKVLANWENCNLNASSLPVRDWLR